MLRVKPLPQKKGPTPKKTDPNNQQNVKPLTAFSTRPRFNSQVPYDTEFLMAKQRVFQKYRTPDDQYVMLDPKNTHKGALIQRGAQLSANKQAQRLPLVDQPSSNLLKNYLQRKERRQIYDQQKFQESTKLSQLLTIQPSTQTERSSRGLSSRISTNTNLQWNDL